MNTKLNLSTSSQVSFLLNPPIVQINESGVKSRNKGKEYPTKKRFK